MWKIVVSLGKAGIVRLKIDKMTFPRALLIDDRTGSVVHLPVKKDFLAWPDKWWLKKKINFVALSNCLKYVA